MRVRGTEVGRCPGSRGLLDADGETGIKKPELEPTCTVYNINPGKNRKLLSECPVLGQYMLFVGHMREYLGKDSEKDLGKQGYRTLHQGRRAAGIPDAAPLARLVMFRETTLPKNEIHLDAETQYLVYCSGGRLYIKRGIVL